jgi:ribosomal protein S18 acetylase RimI-like enzyme
MGEGRVAFELSAIHEKNRGEVVRLFERYPFKGYQKKVQGIESSRLAALIWDVAEPALRRPETGAWVAWRDRPREAVGLAMATPHGWHSDIFGVAMGRIDHLVNYVEPREVGPLLLDAVVEHARRAGIEHLSSRIDGDDWPNVHLLETRGFRCVELSEKMARRLKDLPRPAEAGELRVRPYEPTDLDAIQRIAARSHTHNHFYNDPSLGREPAAAVFGEWLRRCARGLAQFILVAEDADGRVIGFVTALANAALERVVGISVGIIDYIVVDRDAAGKGVGRLLLTAAMQEMARDHQWVELRTSHNNYTALAFYQAAGFRIVSTDFVFHRHEPGKKPPPRDLQFGTR